MNSSYKKNNDIKSKIKGVEETAKDVNHHSILRKDITSKSLKIIDNLFSSNSLLGENFEKIYKALQSSFQEISINLNEFDANVEHFDSIIIDIDVIKKTLIKLDKEIQDLTDIVELIKDDTDEIFTLALNASIVSHKYSSTSDVFDILANKLNEMSNFIHQNLENINMVVNPIIEGINKLIENNNMVLEEIEGGYNSSIGFSDILSKQKKSIERLLDKASETGNEVSGQKDMIKEMKVMITQMENDAVLAIDGSSNVVKESQIMGGIILKADKENDSNSEVIQDILNKSISIWKTAQDVNVKSQSQLEFSINCVAFCDLLILEAAKLTKTTSIIDNQSEENSEMADFLSRNLNQISSLLNDIDEKIIESNRTIQKFNLDYEQINNIVSFLKDILKSMNVIGMMSRIESARDPEEFSQFMAISDNINSLQEHISVNIPNIEENISKTHNIIDSVNDNFQDISSLFSLIFQSTGEIIKKLDDIVQFSQKSKELSGQIILFSDEALNSINELRDLLENLTEIVRNPIKGSADNIERGKIIEALCREVLDNTGQ